MKENAWLKKNLAYTWENKVNSDWIINDLKITKKDIVLDVGCGNGAHLNDIQEKTNARCIGVDIREDLFKLNKNKRVKLLYSDMRDLKIKDNSITKLFSLGVFEHVPETDKVFSEVYRVLQKGGKVLFTVPNKISWFHVTKKIKQAFGLWDIGYEAGFTIKQLNYMLKRQGLRIEREYIMPHEKISNPFNWMDNLLNRLNNHKFGFFIKAIAFKI